MIIKMPILDENIKDIINNNIFKLKYRISFIKQKSKIIKDFYFLFCILFYDELYINI